MKNVSSSFGNLDLNCFAYFAMLGKHSNFTTAAAEMGMSRSKLSRSIAELERYLGICLVERTTRRLTLTNAGLELYKRCQNIVASAEGAYGCLDSGRDMSLDSDSAQSETADFDGDLGVCRIGREKNG